MDRRAMLTTALVAVTGSWTGCLGDDAGGDGVTPTATTEQRLHEDVTVAELILREEDLPADGWIKVGQAIDGPVEYRHGQFNLTVWTSVTIFQSVDDAVTEFESKREQAAATADDVEALDFGDRCVVAAPEGTISMGLLQMDNLLGELRLYRTDPNLEAQPDQVDMAALLEAMFDRWPS